MVTYKQHSCLSKKSKRNKWIYFVTSCYSKWRKFKNFPISLCRMKFPIAVHSYFIISISARECNLSIVPQLDGYGYESTMERPLPANITAGTTQVTANGNRSRLLPATSYRPPIYEYDTTDLCCITHQPARLPATYVHTNTYTRPDVHPFTSFLSDRNSYGWWYGRCGMI